MLFCSMLAGCGANGMSTVVVVTKSEMEIEDESAYAQLLENTPVAEVEGEPLSPNGRYEVVVEGASKNYVSGVRPPEFLRIVDTTSGEVLWEDMGYLWQSAVWSPDSGYLALAYGNRTWNQVVIFEAETWNSWQFVLPDGSPIPEYTFLPQENWGIWTGENKFCLTIGRGGDAGEECIYRCSMRVEEQGFTGSVLQQTTDVLGETYDFDRDGEAESVEIVTLWSPELSGRAAWYELQVKRADGTLLWEQDAAESHVGWTSVFALELEGQDYLLRYNPYMGQGAAGYHYQIFSLDESGGRDLAA